MTRLLWCSRLVGVVCDHVTMIAYDYINIQRWLEVEDAAERQRDEDHMHKQFSHECNSILYRWPRSSWLLRKYYDPFGLCAAFQFGAPDMASSSLIAESTSIQIV